MAIVKSVINPSVTANTPFAYTAPNGLSGYVTTMMLDDNEVVVMVFDDAVDQIGSNVTVKHPIDMSDYWTLDPYYSNVTEGDFFNIGIMNIEFEGNTYTLQHVIYYLNAGWWLTRRATNGEYVASGKNILSNYDTVYTLPDGLSLSDIESPDTDIAGLKPPTEFPSLNFLTVLGSDYEQVGDVFRIKDTGSGGGGGTTPDSNAVDLTSKTEIGNNTFDFSNDFKNSWDYSKFKAIAGFQNYVFRGQVGLLEHFKAGWSHLEFQSYYPTSQSLGEKSAARFSMFQWFVENSNINGAANSLPSEFSTLKNAILSRDFLTANQQSHEAWEMLGAQLSSHLIMYKDIQSGADKFAGVCILDEESNVHLSANGGGPATLQFIAKVCQYVTLKTANSAVIHYGYPANSVHWSTDMWYKDTNLNSCKTELPMAVAKPSFDYYFDGTTTYCKSPLPVSSSLYKKDGNGNYIISGGKRVLRTDPFSEYFGGIKNTWHPSFYNPYSNNYDPIYDGNGEIIGGGIISTITGVKVTDIEYAVAFSFRYVSLLKLVMGTIANQEGGGFDITRYYNSVYKPIAVMNTLTEPFTTGGNGFFRRWIGEEQLKFLYLAPLFAGYDGIYNYEDGFLGTIYYNPDFGNPNNLSLQLPTKGNKIAPWWFFENYQDFGVPWNPQGNNDHLGTLSFNQNLSRFNWITTAVAVMRGVMSYYTKNNTLRFALFNPIGGGINTREVVMIAMYQGSNMHILAWYPFQDITDTTTVTFTINGNTYIQNIRPRMCEVWHLTGSFSTVNPVDIHAQYTNIDGSVIKVTGDPSNHTW
jgi:hypothetical protein